MTWRDVKRRARQVVHDTMYVFAWRVPASGADPDMVRVRLHTAKVKPGNEGLGRLGNLGASEREETHPKLVFLKEEVSPVHNDLYIFTNTEGYRAEADAPTDDITVTIKASRLEPGRVGLIVTQHSLDMTFGVS